MIRCRSVFDLLFVLVVGLLATSQQSAQAAGLQLEINDYLKEVKSEPLRRIAWQKAADLKSKDEEKRKQAVAFFHDVRARYILVELLDHEDFQDLVASKYLGPIEFDCLERLFIITHRSLPKKGAVDDLSAEKQAARNTRIKAINTQAAKVLGVEPVVPTEWHRDAFREAWLKMLMTAKEKRTIWKPVEDTLEKIRQDMKKYQELKDRESKRPKDKYDLPEEKKK
jgi:hypothetical protein